MLNWKEEAGLGIQNCRGRSIRKSCCLQPQPGVPLKELLTVFTAAAVHALE